MSTESSEDKISVRKHIPYNLLLNNIKYDIYSNLANILEEKFSKTQKQFQQLQLLTSSQAHTMPHDIAFLDIRRKIVEQLAQILKETKELEGETELTKKSFQVSKEENNVTLEKIKFYTEDMYLSSEFQNAFWHQILLKIIKKEFSDLKLLEKELTEVLNSLKPDSTIDESHEEFFLMYYANECMLRALEILLINGTDKFPQTPELSMSFNKRGIKFKIFTEEGSLEDTKFFTTSEKGLSSGGGKKSKSKHSRKTKTKKQNKENKKNKENKQNTLKKINKNKKSYKIEVIKKSNKSNKSKKIIKK